MCVKFRFPRSDVGNGRSLLPPVLCFPRSDGRNPWNSCRPVPCFPPAPDLTGQLLRIHHPARPTFDVSLNISQAVIGNNLKRSPTAVRKVWYNAGEIMGFRKQKPGGYPDDGQSPTQPHRMHESGNPDAGKSAKPRTSILSGLSENRFARKSLCHSTGFPYGRSPSRAGDSQDPRTEDRPDRNGETQR